MTDIHSAAQRGFSAEAQTYVRGRPEYPAELASWLDGQLGVGSGKTAVDLGAGTGKFTKLLARTGATVLAVEPVDAMRAQLSAALPGVQALAGSAQTMPLEAGSAEVVICAQAFHWFANEAALAEIHRVLKPDGQLGLVWNVRDESVDWVAAMTEIISPYEGDAPRFHKGDWRRPFSSGRFFDELQLTTFGHVHVGSPQEVIIDRSLSISFIAALSAEEKTLVAERLQALINTHPALRAQATVSFPYRTEAYRSRRRAA